MRTHCKTSCVHELMAAIDQIDAITVWLYGLCRACTCLWAATQLISQTMILQLAPASSQSPNRVLDRSRHHKSGPIMICVSPKQEMRAFFPTHEICMKPKSFLNPFGSLWTPRRICLSDLDLGAFTMHVQRADRHYREWHALCYCSKWTMSDGYYYIYNPRAHSLVRVSM